MKTPQLKIKSLYLRSVKKDVDEIFEGWIKDERISRYMLWNASDDREDARHFVEEEIKQINSDTWYRWIIILQKTGQIIGTCLLYDNVTEKSWDISYNLSYCFFKLIVSMIFSPIWAWIFSPIWVVLNHPVRLSHPSFCMTDQ